MINKEDIEAVARAAEEDAGTVLPGLRESLNEMIEGKFAKKYTPEQILVISARRS